MQRYILIIEYKEKILLKLKFIYYRKHSNIKTYIIKENKVIL